MHIECAIAYQSQQWLRERATVLRRTYVAYLVMNVVSEMLNERMLWSVASCNSTNLELIFFFK